MAGVYSFFGGDGSGGDVILGDIPRVLIRNRGMRGLLLRIVFVCFGDNDGIWRGPRHADWRVDAAWCISIERVALYYTHRYPFDGRSVSICVTVIYTDEIVLRMCDSNTHSHRSDVFYDGPNGVCATTLGVARDIGGRGSRNIVLCRCKWHGEK